MQQAHFSLKFYKCVLCSVLINVHELVLKMNVKNMHGEKIKTVKILFTCL